MPSCKVCLCFKGCFSPWLPCQGMVGCFLDTLPVFPADPSSQTIQGGSASAGRGASVGASVGVSVGVSAPQGGVMGTSSPSWRPQESPSEGPRQSCHSQETIAARPWGLHPHFPQGRSGHQPPPTDAPGSLWAHTEPTG